MWHQHYIGGRRFCLYDDVDYHVTGYVKRVMAVWLQNTSRCFVLYFPKFQKRFNVNLVPITAIQTLPLLLLNFSYGGWSRLKCLIRYGPINCNGPEEDRHCLPIELGATNLRPRSRGIDKHFPRESFGVLWGVGSNFTHGWMHKFSNLICGRIPAATFLGYFILGRFHVEAKHALISRVGVGLLVPRSMQK